MTFYFYDLETTGLRASTGRIVQFAGQRTSIDLKPIGKPQNILVKLSEDVIPDPETVLIHKITPQKSIEEGYSEADFLSMLSEDVFQPETIFAGFNTIRFDDEFMRYTLWRNFYDPYEWQWRDNASRWDMLDVSRMMRALRPEGLKWPLTPEGAPTNRLELLTKLNGIEHSRAHDALADVQATIELAGLLKKAQPKLWQFLIDNRSKKAVAKVVSLDNPLPIVHSSGRISSEFEKTSVFYPIAVHPTNPNSVLVFDLRQDPKEFQDVSVKDIEKRLFATREELEKEGLSRIPIKAIHLNKCPAVAPLGVLDEAAQMRIKLSIKTVQSHYASVDKLKSFALNLVAAYENKGQFDSPKDPDQQLYDGFLDDSDRAKVQQVRSKNATELADFNPDFTDERLPSLLLRYKARNFPTSLNESEKELWQVFKQERKRGKIRGAIGLEVFMKRLYALTQRSNLSSEDEFLLTEMQLYGESLAETEE